jgi:hypothetical protein
MDNLLRFNSQFDPAWQRRYVILQAWADLPRVALAAMAAEGYLPHARLIRGRSWSPPTGKPRPTRRAGDPTRQHTPYPPSDPSRR